MCDAAAFGPHNNHDGGGGDDGGGDDGGDDRGDDDDAAAVAATDADAAATDNCDSDRRGVGDGINDGDFTNVHDIGCRIEHHDGGPPHVG